MSTGLEQLLSGKLLAFLDSAGGLFSRIASARWQRNMPIVIQGI